MFNTKLVNTEDEVSFLTESEQSQPATNVYSGIFKIGYAVGTPLHFEGIITATVNQYTQAYTAKSIDEETQILSKFTQNNITKYASDIFDLQLDLKKLETSLEKSPNNTTLIEDKETLLATIGTYEHMTEVLKELGTTIINTGASALTIITDKIAKTEKYIQKMRQLVAVSTGGQRDQFEKNLSLLLFDKSTLDLLLFTHIYGGNLDSFIQNYAHDQGLEKIILMTDSPSAELLKR